MPSPVAPSAIKETIPNATGNFCDKFVNVFKLPGLVYADMAYMFNEDGTINDGFAADICGLGCIGSGGTSGGLVPVLNASDGLYSNKIVVSWTKVTDATGYEVFRNEGVDDPTDPQTVSIGTVSGNIWEDGSVSAGKIYWYWVKAIVGGVEGAFSNGDQGSVGTGGGTIDAINSATFKVSQGYFGVSQGLGKIVLEFDPVAGADAYEVYRSSTGAFAGEQTLINPESVSGTDWHRWQTPSPGPAPGGRSSTYQTVVGGTGTYRDNFWIKKSGKLVFTDDNLPSSFQSNTTSTWAKQPTEGTIYYYKVIGKKLGTSAIGDLSAAPIGHGYTGARPGYTNSETDTFYQSTDFDNSGNLTLATGGKTKLRIVLRGTGGAGSGGDQTKAGAGGGGGGIVCAEFTLAGETWVLHAENTNVPSTTVHQTSGADGNNFVLKKNGAEVLRVYGGKGGVYNASSPCTGGDGGTGDLMGITPDANNEILVGESGYADTNLNGGYGGATFGIAEIQGQKSGFGGQGSGGAGQQDGVNPLLRRAVAANIAVCYATFA